jgi:hypothetical protein
LKLQEISKNYSFKENVKEIITAFTVFYLRISINIMINLVHIWDHQVISKIRQAAQFFETSLPFKHDFKEKTKNNE